MKICCKCQTEKQVSEFYKRPERKDGYQPYCKSCFSVYCAERWKRTKLKAIDYKGNKCQDCDKSFAPYLYDFHHLDPTKKDVDWAKLRLRSWKRITTELDKCVLLCCMCHRVREYGPQSPKV